MFPLFVPLTTRAPKRKFISRKIEKLHNVMPLPLPKSKNAFSFHKIRECSQTFRGRGVRPRRSNGRRLSLRGYYGSGLQTPSTHAPPARSRRMMVILAHPSSRAAAVRLGHALTTRPFSMCNTGRPCGLPPRANFSTSASETSRQTLRVSDGRREAGGRLSPPARPP